MAEWRGREALGQGSANGGATESPWQQKSRLRNGIDPIITAFPPLQENISTDVAIVGAGLTGMTAALILQKAGYEVTVLDARTVSGGDSALHPGHLSHLLPETRYRSLINAFGGDALRAVNLSLEHAIDFIARTIREERIDCGFRRVPAYWSAEKVAHLKAFQDEYMAAELAGLQINRTFNAPLPFLVEEAMHIDNQAVLDPLRYVRALARIFVEHGGTIWENSRVTDVETKNGVRIRTDNNNATVSAHHAILATNMPIGFRPIIQSLLEARRCYMIAFRTEEPLEEVLYWDFNDPCHSIQVAEHESGPLVILSGERHRTGDGESPERCFLALENYARQRFRVRSVDYRWSAQWYNPVDGLPYIGKLSGAYIATGYAGEELTFGTLAARLISDQIQGWHNDCTEILNPARNKPLASAGGFLTENLETLTHFVKDRLKKAVYTSPDEVPSGEGAICDINGQKTAVYHAPEGIMHLMSPVCTHMNCLVRWNGVEKSWDCPCHGGRFDATGKVINGPPVVDLQPMEFS